MSSLEEIRAVRLQKLEKLKEKGIDPYPAISRRTHTIAEAITQFEKLEIAADADAEVITKAPHIVLSGRVLSLRVQGALIFFNFSDGSGVFQGLYKNTDNTADDFSFFNEVVDIGDFIEVSGTLFTTRTKQQTILVSGWTMLSKSLLPLPEKWHGLQDIEERYRKRYLDILSNPELREMFEKKAAFWDATRAFLKERGFLEVETPTLEVTTGGAEANPFKTHHKDYDMHMFLRISVGELWQKRLMAAGFPKTFEIGRVYRNEGTSPDHLQEFTNMEFYWAYADYEAGMNLVQDMYRSIAQKVFGKTEFTTRGHTFDLAHEWKRIDYCEEIQKQTGVDVLTATEEDLMKKLDELKVVYEGKNRERLTDTLWKYCRKNIGGPAFLINHPKLVGPLAKTKTDNGNVVQMFQPLIAGSEVGRGYSELNDPTDQRARFEMQQKLIESGDEEAMMPEWEFVDMLEHGMPPTCGFGFGERFFAFLLDKPIRETQFFPLMRPDDQPSGKKENDIAVVVLNAGAELVPWQQMNAVAHLTAAFAARTDSKLFSQDKIQTSDLKNIRLNIKNAIMIKQADDNKVLKEMLMTALDQKLQVAEFTREMIETTSDKKVISNTKAKSFDEIEHLGILIFGPKSIVDKITAEAKLVS